MKKYFLTLAFILFSHSVLAKSNVDTTLLNEMLTTINNEYLQPVNNEELVLYGLQALHDIDKNIVISKGGNKIYIYYNQKVSKIANMPEDKKSILGWIKTLETAINGATAISENASLHDFEIPDLMMKKITQNLDKYSHYYSEFDYNEDEDSNKIYTLYSSRKIDDYLYLRIRVFNKQTAKMVKDSLEAEKPYKGVVMDLRGNSGGILNEALKIADFFTDNEIITYTAKRNNENIHYYTSNDGELYDGPLAILIDGATASAAEVLAGGLQEQSRAKLVGTHSSS